MLSFRITESETGGGLRKIYLSKRQHWHFVKTVFLFVCFVFEGLLSHCVLFLIPDFTASTSPSCREGLLCDYIEQPDWLGIPGIGQVENLPAFHRQMPLVTPRHCSSNSANTLYTHTDTHTHFSMCQYGAVLILIGMTGTFSFTDVEAEGQ